MSIEFDGSENTVFAPLNTVIDGDRDYRDNALSGCGCGCNGAPGGCGMGYLGEEKTPNYFVIIGVPLLLIALVSLPQILDSQGAPQDW
jgi:hypothetical protein